MNVSPPFSSNLSQESLKSSGGSPSKYGRSLSTETLQDSGISCSPSQFERVKKIAVRQIKSPGMKPAGSFESEGEMDIVDDFAENEFDLRPMPDASDEGRRSVSDTPNKGGMSSLFFGKIKNFGTLYNKPNVDEDFLMRKDVYRRIKDTHQDGTPPSSKSFDIFKRPNEKGNAIDTFGQPKRIKSIPHSSFSEGALAANDPNSADDSTEDDDSSMDLDGSFEIPKPKMKMYRRSHSESAVSIMKAIDSFDNDPMMIGDATNRFVLPIIPCGKHRDLKEISPATVIKLMNGEYNPMVSSFEIIDCRYPYEYNGGHIRGAINIHTQKQLHEKYLLDRVPVDTNQRSTERKILVFHCEFSSQRAPDMCRFLREADRKCNVQNFPALHYPELYVLHGGYKAFYEQHKAYCVPEEYVEMSHPNYSEEYRQHKALSKSELIPIKSSSNLSLMKGQRKASFKKF